MDKAIVAHFRKVDPILAALIDRIEPFSVVSRQTYFADLCEAIINQQLSEKAGATIFARFAALFPQKSITPEYLLSIPDKSIREIGSSWSKINYLKVLAQTVVDNRLDLTALPDLPEEEVITTLTKVKGIGRWTAEMFLMFTLARPDVFSMGDLGLRRAVQKLYGFKKEPTPKQLEKISQKWSPYRTYAARILWKSLDLK